MTFGGKVAWITGASSGIGQTLATALLERGASVILSGRRADALEQVAAAAPARALVLPFEATAFNALPGVVDLAWAWRGRIDLLINSAGISQRSLALDTLFDVYRQLIDVDYLAPVALTQQILPRMVAQRHGHIATISSVAGKARSAAANRLLRRQARRRRLLRRIARRSRDVLWHPSQCHPARASAHADRR